jgi:excisionase family DNA binding protein
MAPEPDALARFLTIADVADALALSAQEVTDMVHSGELPAIRVAGAWRIEVAVLKEFIETRYEVERRARLWEEANFANIPELSGGSILRSSPLPGPVDGEPTD